MRSEPGGSMWKSGEPMVTDNVSYDNNLFEMIRVGLISNIQAEIFKLKLSSGVSSGVVL